MMRLVRACQITCLFLAVMATGCQQDAINLGTQVRDLDPRLLVERGGLQFVADSKVGLQLATQRESPCLLFFTAEWCTYCHQMEETAFADPAIKQLAEQFVCVLVDADREPAVCREFAVSGYPTIQFVAADGRTLHSLIGKQSAAQLASGMQAAIERLAWLHEGTTVHQ